MKTKNPYLISITPTRNTFSTFKFSRQYIITPIRIIGDLSDRERVLIGLDLLYDELADNTFGSGYLDAVDGDDEIPPEESTDS